ncbi:MAG: elongation factor G [Deltaproteobacteria bacterium]|nr:elongation factor G [Deltaproteobacteria bacterium]
MKKYEAADIRTIALIGHGKCGKTSLAEAFLYNAKVTTRLGKVDDETSSLDTEPEEIARKSSLQLGVGHCEWKKKKINFIDTPGDANFGADALLGTSVADAVVCVVSAPDGVQVGTERTWALAAARELPAAIFINKLDRDRASFDRTLEEVREVLTKKAVALQLPIGEEAQFSGVVDLLSLKGYTLNEDGRSITAGDIPAELQETAATARAALIEGIAESDDDLLEKYFEAGELTEEEIHQGLAAGILKGSFVPVFCGSATRNVGAQPLLDLIANNFPSPLTAGVVKGKDASGNDAERECKADAPMSALVFKSIGTDVGRVALMRVLSGTMTSDMNMVNATRNNKERVGQIYAMVGKKRENLDQAVVGDIVGLAKLRDTRTGDTLCAEKQEITYELPEIPQPVISYAIRPKTKGEEEKVATKLHDMIAEDISLHLDRDMESKSMLLRGLGQVHIEMAVERLKRLGVEVELDLPTVAYRETIRGKATHVEGKHKKQTGGRGQFGVCFLDMEPKPKGTDTDDALEFVDAIFGGSIPRQFVPAIEKGIRTRMARGVVAGFPVVNIKVTLTDGKFHPVDSDGRSFEMAGSKGFHEAFKKAQPVLLEPTMTLEVHCPEDNMGDIIGDISSRRGKVLGTEAKGRTQIIKALVPQSEILRYAIDLESITAGRGSFTASFAQYDELPPNLAQEIMDASKMAEDDD